MPRQLPNLATLRDAVRYVIESNIADGYTPSRFIQTTQNGDALNLFEICQGFVRRGETIEPIEKALKRFPTLVTIEDFVQRSGLDWGFAPMTVENARQRAEYFDQVVGKKRYTSAQ